MRTKKIFKHNFHLISVLLIFTALLSDSSLYAFGIDCIDVHGFVSQGYLKSSQNNYLAKTKDGTTEFNEIALNVSSELADKLRVGFQFLARDLGDAGNDEVVLDWGFGDYHWRDVLGVRIGKVKRPMGLYNECRDVDLLRTSIILPQSIYHMELRDVQIGSKGGALYGTLPVCHLGSFDYQIVYGSHDTDMEPVNVKNQLAMLVPGQDLANVSLEAKYIRTLQILWHSPIKGLQLGCTYEIDRLVASTPFVPQVQTNTPGIFIPEQQARNITFDVRKLWIVSAQYRFWNLTFTTEYLEQNTKIDLDLAGAPFIDSLTRGYYYSIDYRVTPHFAVAAYYSEYYPDRRDKDGDALALEGYPEYMGWQKDACLSMRLDPLIGWTLKLEAHHINGVAQVFDYADVNDLHQYWSLYAAKITYNF